MLEKALIDKFAEEGNSAQDRDGSWLGLQLEDLVGGAGKDAGKDQRQFQAGHVAIALNGVDALAGDAGGVGQLRPGSTRGRSATPLPGL